MENLWVLRKDVLFEIYYYKGYTSYKHYFREVFNNNLSKLKKIIDLATEKANNGCNIDFTFIRFKYNNEKYIDIPFDVFSEKKDMSIRRRNNKLWNKVNIKRLLVSNPGLRMLDDDMVNEAKERLYDSILKG